MSKIIDLRSDTITRPTKEMRDAMRNAPVGDDYYGEDATVVALEELAAGKLGKEAGLLVASGTMGNLVSILTHTQRGDAVLMEADAHLYRCETAHIAAVCGVLPKRIKGRNNGLHPDDVEAAVFGKGVLYPTTRLVCIENTHNAAGGTCTTPVQMHALKAVADRHGMAVHVDGARIFNAAVSLGVAPEALARDADSLTFCLSKGLSCPFGSLIVGDRAFIAQARRYRQMVGGGMRQAGIMAAAGIVALNTMIERLVEDHENARALAKGLLNAGIELDLDRVQSNMVFFEVSEKNAEADLFVRRLGEFGVRVNPPAGRRVRAVTHRGVNRENINAALKVIAKLLSE